MVGKYSYLIAFSFSVKYEVRSLVFYSCLLSSWFSIFPNYWEYHLSFPVTLLTSVFGLPWYLLLLLLSRISRVWLCATPWTAAHQAPPSLGFSRQKYWNGLPCPSPMHESEKWKWSRSVVSDSLRPHGLQPTRLPRPWDFPGKSTGVGCHRLLRKPFIWYVILNTYVKLH